MNARIKSNRKINKTVLAIVGVIIAVLAIGGIASAAGESASSTATKGSAVVAGESASSTAAPVTVTATTTRDVPTTVTAPPVTRTVEAASTVNSDACEKALAAGEDMDGYINDLSEIGADSVRAAFAKDADTLNTLTAKVETLTTKVHTARAALGVNSALCRASL